MTDAALADLVKKTLYAVAPDIAEEPIEADRTFREQFEIDSMDFLNFIIGLHKATGLEIPEADYPQLTTLRGCIDYLKSHGKAA